MTEIDPDVPIPYGLASSFRELDEMHEDLVRADAQIIDLRMDLERCSDALIGMVRYYARTCVDLAAMTAQRDVATDKVAELKGAVAGLEAQLAQCRNQRDGYAATRGGLA